MSTPRITTKLLKQREACPGQLELFRKLFPRGAVVTEANVRKGIEAGLEVEWLCGNDVIGTQVYWRRHQRRVDAWVRAHPGAGDAQYYREKRKLRKKYYLLPAVPIWTANILEQFEEGYFET